MQKIEMPQNLKEVLNNWKSNLLAPLRTPAELQAQEDSEREGLALAMQQILDAQAMRLVEQISCLETVATGEAFSDGFEAAQNMAINTILNSLHTKPNEDNQAPK